MGYQVGHVCYADREQAENAYFSQVPPTIASDSGMYRFYYNKGVGWGFKGEKVTISLPECSPFQNFKDGAEVGFMFMVTAILLWAIVNIKDLLNRMMG